jgi:hypothetical protein
MKYLWFFRGVDEIDDNVYFPLCWSDKAPSSKYYYKMTKEERAFIDYILQEEVIDPESGVIDFWVGLENLDFISF